MPLSAAERQRRYRERLKEVNPEKWKQVKEENARRTKKKYKRIGELSEKEKEARRKVWRKAKKKYDETKEEKKHKGRKDYQTKYSIKYRRLNNELKKAYKKIKTLKGKNENLRKKVYRYKILQNTRNEYVYNSEESRSSNIASPYSKADSLLQHLPIPSYEKEVLRKELVEKYVLEEAMRSQYTISDTNARKALKSALNGDIVRKYKMTNKLQKFIGLKTTARISNKNPVKHNKLAAKIKEFFLQDDVSRATAGKKETKTYKKNKMQRRYLIDHMKNLRLKFIKETGIPVSYSTLIRYKPFYVLIPKLSNRDTCACKNHANIEFKFTALKKLSIFKEFGDMKDVLKAIVCDIKSKSCMYSECDICKQKCIDYDLSKINLNETVTWTEWITKEVHYVKRDQAKKTKKVQKEAKSGELKDLITKFEKELQQFKIHCFNISHQYNAYKYLKENLSDKEMLVHCDFSENYSTKLHTEIQAKHFGPSQIQISLHTSVIYKDNSLQSYCTLSNSVKHTPEAIWAHLLPILTDIRAISPEIDTLHIYSDGPTSQYRQKKNFYLFNNLTKQLGFVKATWNFFEAAHGKGAADGVGGHVKRLLDSHVAHGFDITDAETAFEILNAAHTKVKTHLVTEEEINKIEEQINSLDLVPVPQTFKIHQVMTTPDMKCVNYRLLSCFCGNTDTKGFCQCYTPKMHTIIKEKKFIKKRRVVYSSSEEENSLSPKKKKVRRKEKKIWKLIQQ